MKFSEMPYERPDMSALKEQFAALTERLQNAPDYAAARAAFLEEQVLNKHVDTLFTLASVRLPNFVMRSTCGYFGKAHTHTFESCI